MTPGKVNIWLIELNFKEVIYTVNMLTIQSIRNSMVISV